ncbi:MAG: type I DNA topoisomerase [Candidatus Pacebacteria bacterium]|nr:type I DNA topoisomerase [Candidatus Paceibacterota bacterium]
MQLIIVESPTKGKTLEKFLGSQYRVLSSYGHVRDLPKTKFGIDVENDFAPTYIIMPKAKKNVELLKKEIKKADSVILATDEDREGEAIAYHLTQALDLKDPKRIVFHEITKSAIKEALENPRKIDMALVDAQQARRFLDRIVGYKLSPFLWKKVARGLSAGRVQSIAVKLVVEREEVIKNFKPQEYWTIIALLKKSSALKQIFEAFLIKKDNKVLDKLEISNKKEADKIVKDLNEVEYKILNIDEKETKRNPLPPFTTSTLQQTAWQKFRLPAKITMRIAQGLYEKGFITYHRTDSLNLSNQSLFSAKKFIIDNCGEKYWPGFPRKYKTKAKGAQEAHEAIRPSYPDKSPEKLKLGEEDKSSSSAVAAARLYDLIWRRFVACQMSQAIFDSTTVDISAKNHTFRVNGQMLKFDGFLKIYPIKYEEKDLPSLKKDEVLKLVKLDPSQHFTEPPARYNEATIIKTLEENGIGRPSTYAPILSNIQDKNYIEKDEQRRFRPTEIGTVVNNLLVAHFPEIVDIGFTAKMEEDLDEIAQKKKELVPVIKEFYKPFEKNLKQKYEEVSKKDITEKPTEKTCPKCGAPLLIRIGRYGEFYACSKFPKCRYTESLEKNNLGVKCPKCKNGKIVEKRTKKRKIFYGCDQFPKCDFALWDKPTGEKCKKCDSLMVKTIRWGEKCSNKECDFKIEKERKL